MHFFYNVFIFLVEKFLPVSAWFSPKMKAFVQGRKEVFPKLKEHLPAEAQLIWIHAASLGEYEQAVPVMQALRQQYPDYKLLLSFFSPSGYEIRKNNPYAFLTVYLPLDTTANAKKFIQTLRPKLAIFVKYEVWPNLLFRLQESGIPALLLSGVFRKSQLFFKPYGGFMQRALNSFQHIFVQEAASKTLLEQHGFSQVSVGGDTRYDRVSQQLTMDNHLSFIDSFKGQSLCMVCGSTWPEDEAILIDFINQYAGEVKFIVAPHQINPTKIATFRAKIQHKTILFSEKKEKNPAMHSVFILDTVGLLTKVYSYADIAYVGGAMGNTGLHNILEPAAFGIPVIFGPNHQNFPEATQLQQAGGGFEVNSANALTRLTSRLINDEPFRKKTGKQAQHFIERQTGATHRFMEFLTAENQIFNQKDARN